MTLDRRSTKRSCWARRAVTGLVLGALAQVVSPSAGASPISTTVFGYQNGRALNLTIARCQAPAPCFLVTVTLSDSHAELPSEIAFAPLYLTGDHVRLTASAPIQILPAQGFTDSLGGFQALIVDPVPPGTILTASACEYPQMDLDPPLNDLPVHCANEVTDTSTIS